MPLLSEPFSVPASPSLASAGRPSRSGLLPVAPLLALLVAGCTTAVEQPSIAATVRPVAPVTQLAVSGADVPVAPTVQVVDSTGQPVASVAVHFAVRDSASVEHGDQLTDRRGMATAGAWRTASGAPGTHRVEVSTRDALPVSFAAVALPAEIAASPTAQRCPIPTELIPDFASASHAAALVREKRPMRIVALGSSSTYGQGATSPQRNYPAQLRAKLAAAFPGSAITVVNAGVNGNRTADMVARFPTDVFQRDPDLVIWQTGTNDVTSHVSLVSFVSTLQSGLRQLRERNIDVVLMDSQRFPGVGESDTMRAFVQALHDVAARQGVSVIPRYAWMTSLVASGRYEYGDLLSADGLHMNDVMYECVAHYALVGIARAVYTPPAAP